MRLEVAQWRALLRPGDIVMVVLGLMVCAYAVLSLWQGGAPDGAVVRAGGRVVAEVDLTRERLIEVPGPLGVSVIEIRPGRARVASDPGPRQYCVRQGWLSRSGAVAICAPNQVSLSLAGGQAEHDSLNY